jgi:hypothetical protein
MPHVRIAWYAVGALVLILASATVGAILAKRSCAQFFVNHELGEAFLLLNIADDVRTSATARESLLDGVAVNVWTVANIPHDVAKLDLLAISALCKLFERTKLEVPFARGTSTLTSDAALQYLRRVEDEARLHAKHLPKALVESTCGI